MEQLEIWKDVEGYEGLYMVSNYGRVKSLNYARIKGNEQLMSPRLVEGYHKLTLWKERKSKTDGVHRIVAKAFIPSPNNLPQVHHKDHNPLNNHVDNLEWVTVSQNTKYNYLTGGQKGKTNMKGKFGADNPESKTIKRIAPDGTEVIFIGISEAAREVNGSASHIVKVCKGKLKTHKGYKWQYA